MVATGPWNLKTRRGGNALPSTTINAHSKMRIVDIREQTIPISRYSDPQIPSDGLNTTVVAVITDVDRDGAPVVGFGFSSVGRYGQSGLIRERFAPRLLAAHENELVA